MKKLLAALLVALSAACTTLGDLSPRGAITASYQTVEVLVDQATTAVARGRLSQEKGFKVLELSRKARQSIGKAEQALVACGTELKNCDSVTKILEEVQPLLLEMERELRAKEKQ